ncbi:MAG TPA: fatty acyl-AMP ligase [Thermoanaerobaculia bacterium]|nr:fatty acyl-AMP ligase [Thermoanaerobaculia bacterium]
MSHPIDTMTPTAPTDVNPAASLASWIEVLRLRASREEPSRPAYLFLTDGEREADQRTYADLERRALALGAALQQRGLSGKRALLLLPPGLAFVDAFLGCLCAGVVAVPAYPPASDRPNDRTLPRLRAIAADARPAVVLTTAAFAGHITPLAAALGASCLAVEEVPDDLAATWQDPGVGRDTLAFLQYTSGSTAAPKGVMISHGNLLANEVMIQAAFAQTAESVIVGWLPLYHDMGLIGNVLQPLFVGAPCVLMSPLAFLQRPRRWLEAITRYRATTSGGPNFAYDLCVRRVGPADRAGLDLSTWQVAFNGAEPVREESLERFGEAFAEHGFHRSAFYPCYGLAEATLFVSGSGRTAEPVVGEFDAEALAADRVAPAPPATPESDGRSRRLVGCGHAWGEEELVIADPEQGTECPAGRVGEIWIAGPHVARGYWHRPEETARDFGAQLAGPAGPRGPFLKSGDLGFIQDGQLFIAGRAKDLVILRGRNLYPQDLELTAERGHGALRAGCSAAFSVEREGEERLILVMEVDRGTDPAEFEKIAEAVRVAVARDHEARVEDLVLLAPGSIPKTSSGKIQRHACRAAFLAGEPAEAWRSSLSAG